MKTVIITGSNGILGRKLVQNCIEAHYDVIGIDLSGSKYFHEKYRHYSVDLTSEMAIKDFCLELSGKPVHGLINNAATKPEGFFASTQDYLLETWNNVITVNLTAPMLLSKHLFGNLRMNPGGTIVNLSSIYGVRAPISQIYDDALYPALGGKINTPLIYSVTKTALIGLTRHLSSEWGPQGIRVNSVSPGGIFSGQNEVFVKQYSSYTSLGRMATEQDITNAVLFLISESANYITGHNLIVDGGWTS